MKISKRYPVVNGDIDREWLVDQLPRAKRPNALLEVVLQPLPIYRIALQTWISVDTLIDFLFGDDDLTPFELHALDKTLDIFNAGDATEYLARETLDIIEDPEEVSSNYKEWRHVGGLINKLLESDPVPAAAIFAAGKAYDLAGDHPADLGPYDKPRSKRITRRRRKAVVCRGGCVQGVGA